MKHWAGRRWPSLQEQRQGRPNSFEEYTGTRDGYFTPPNRSAPPGRAVSGPTGQRVCPAPASIVGPNAGGKERLSASHCADYKDHWGQENPGIDADLLQARLQHVSNMSSRSDLNDKSHDAVSACNVPYPVESAVNERGSTVWTEPLPPPTRDPNHSSAGNEVARLEVRQRPDVQEPASQVKTSILVEVQDAMNINRRQSSDSPLRSAGIPPGQRSHNSGPISSQLQDGLDAPITPSPQFVSDGHANPLGIPKVTRCYYDSRIKDDPSSTLPRFGFDEHTTPTSTSQHFQRRFRSVLNDDPTSNLPRFGFDHHNHREHEARTDRHVPVDAAGELRAPIYPVQRFQISDHEVRSIDAISKVENILRLPQNLVESTNLEPSSTPKGKSTGFCPIRTVNDNLGKPYEATIGPSCLAPPFVPNSVPPLWLGNAVVALAPGSPLDSSCEVYPAPIAHCDPSWPPPRIYTIPQDPVRHNRIVFDAHSSLTGISGVQSTCRGPDADTYPPENIRPTPQNMRYGPFQNPPAHQSRNTPLGSGRLQNASKSGMHWPGIKIGQLLVTNRSFANQLGALLGGLMRQTEFLLYHPLNQGKLVLGQLASRKRSAGPRKLHH